MEGYLIKESNLQMVRDIVIKKIYNQTGVIFKETDPFFKNNVNMIIMTIIENEINNFKSFPIEKAVLKLNTIFILECVSFFINSLQETSTSIDDLQEEEPIIEAPQPKPISLPQPVQQPQVVEQTFKQEVLFFEQNETDEYLLNFTKIKSLKLLMFSFDFCDYIVNERNNSFYIDTELVQIPIGNYTPLTLHNKIKDYFNYDDIGECFIPLKPVNFDLKNSIGPLLGFDRKTYKTRGNKHRICYPKYVNLKIHYDDTIKDYKIFLNVDYNNRVFFKTDTTIKLDSIKKVFVDLDYNTRGRRYCFKLLVN